MPKARSAEQILKKIGNPHLHLFRGQGYWYFVYDSGSSYNDHSVMCKYLKDMELDSWVDEGKEFVKEMEAEQ